MDVLIPRLAALPPGGPAATSTPPLAFARGTGIQDPSACRPDARGGNRTVHLNSSVSISGEGTANDGEGNMMVAWSGPQCSVAIRVRGRPVFTEAEDDVASLPRGGRFEITDEAGSTDRSYLVTNRDGQLVRRYRVNGDDAPPDQEALTWRRSLIVAFLRRSGFDAEARAARIQRARGFEGLVAEITAMPSDGGKTRYLEVALRNPAVSASQVGRLLAATEAIDSDGDRASVLGQVPARLLVDGSVQAAYLRVVQGIDSDGDVASVLTRLFRSGTVDGSNCEWVLGLVGGIGSDGDRSSVLITAAPTFRDNQPCLARAIDLTGDIGSDGDKASTLISFVSRLGLSAQGWPAFFRATKTIGSDGDHSAVLHRVLALRAPEEAVVLAVLEDARGIGSDGDLGSVLVETARRGLVRSPAVRSAYLATARRIGSDGDREAALRAIGETERQRE